VPLEPVKETIGAKSLSRDKRAIWGMSIW
jgi:hypothetical protein